jgi:hypothetical protein
VGIVWKIDISCRRSARMEFCRDMELNFSQAWILCFECLLNSFTISHLNPYSDFSISIHFIDQRINANAILPIHPIDSPVPIRKMLIRTWSRPAIPLRLLVSFPIPCPMPALCMQDSKMRYQTPEMQTDNAVCARPFVLEKSRAARIDFSPDQSRARNQFAHLHTQELCQYFLGS